MMTKGPIATKRWGHKSLLAHALETRTAIDWFVLLRQKRHLRGLSALGTGDGVHLTNTTNAATSSTSCDATIGATTWLIQQALLLIEFLLACGEDEVLAAIAAAEGLVLEVQNNDLLWDGNWCDADARFARTDVFACDLCLV